MRVGLFGFYREGNFGDDLMALLAGAELRRAGHEVWVLGLEAKLAGHHGLRRVETAGELVAATEAVVLGGGGLFTAPRKDSGAAAARFAGDLDELVAAAEAAGRPLHAWSLGGDGEGPNPPLRPAAARLLGSPVFCGGTVRRQADCELLRAAGKPVAAFPDVVLATAAYRTGLPPAMTPVAARPVEAKTWIVTALGDRPVDVGPRRLLRHGASRWPGVAVGAVGLSLAEYRRDARRWPGRGRYTLLEPMDPVALLDVLAAADLVISHRLHISLAAWSLGTPVVTCHPRPKVRAALRELGASPEATVTGAFGLWRALRRRMRTGRATALGWLGNHAEATRAAQGHVAALHEMLAGRRVG